MIKIIDRNHDSLSDSDSHKYDLNTRDRRGGGGESTNIVYRYTTLVAQVSSSEVVLMMSSSSFRGRSFHHDPDAASRHRGAAPALHRPRPVVTASALTPHRSRPAVGAAASALTSFVDSPWGACSDPDAAPLGAPLLRGRQEGVRGRMQRRRRRAWCWGT